MNLGRLIVMWLDVRPIKRWKAHRQAKKAGQALPPAETEELPMNSAVLTQIVLGLLRHAMTAAAPLGFVLSDNALMELAGVIVTTIGLAWMAVRKVKTPTPT
jgi:hypothetical protein